MQNFDFLRKSKNNKYSYPGNELEKTETYLNA